MHRSSWPAVGLAVMGLVVVTPTKSVAGGAVNVIPKSVLAKGVGWKERKPSIVLPASKPDPDPDENEPDKSAWQIFLEINKPAASQRQVGAAKLTTNDVVWETWADNELTFPSSPDPNNPPQWPTAPAAFPAKRLMPPAQNLIRQLLKEGKQVPPGSLRTPIEDFKPFVINPKKPPKGVSTKMLAISIGGGEEVRRNRASFQFIVDHKLYYKDGLAKAFAKGETIAFPLDAIEIKARWVPIDEAEKSEYHWNYDSTGKLFGLVALHIMSKRLPNWTWATWEWSGNPGRCDYIGCRDEFGVNLHVIKSKVPTGQTYPAGTLSPSLEALFSSSGVTDEWKNYRLKGSQVLFTDTTGKPTLLGNSIAENGFVESSSCITCHGVAATDDKGNVDGARGFVAGQSVNGPLVPAMFWTSGTPSKLKDLPLDFVWSFLAAQ